MWSDYLWILIASIFFAFFTSFGIGANDVANAFATSVGAKSVTLVQAVAIAAVFEFAGAILLGADVTETVSHGLVDTKRFDAQPELLMYGMMCVIAATGLWLLLACYLELPVSTTHSTIGGVIGFTLVAHGWNAVRWFEYDASKPGLDKFEGVVPIIASWFTSPILAGCLAVGLFLFVRTFILRAERSFEKSLTFFPFLVGMACLINIYYICLVGFDKKKVHHHGKRESISDVLGFGWSSLIAWVISITVSVLLWWKFIPWLKKRSAVEDRQTLVQTNDSETTVSPALRNPEKDAEASSSYLSLAAKTLETDVHGVIESDATVNAVHQQSETFDASTERCFSYLQVFTAACVSFAHGANDVANSIGPLAAVYSIYRHGHVTENSSVPFWILVLGGGGIVMGLAMYGHTIIRAIGVKLVKVSPARGFAMEFATATVIAFGSIYGIPLSTTHCQVGSTTAVGLVEGRRGINLPLLLKVFVGWIVTIVIVALTTAFFYAQAVYAPSQLNLNSIQHYEEGINLACLTASQALQDSERQNEVQSRVAGFEENKMDSSSAQVAFLQNLVSEVVDSCQSDLN